VRPALEDAAVRAVHALRVEHGGVDLLEHPSGRLYLLEANFPCYYPQAQRIGGIDVAGAMVDYLLEKAVRLTEAGPPGRTA
jgi:glutathione synthase/RimK-type ligase-like ATP-grasp enzyme